MLRSTPIDFNLLKALPDAINNKRKSNARLKQFLSGFGKFTGGILLGLSSGGGVYTAYREIAPITLTGGVLSLTGSIILAISWGMIYSKQPGPKLIQQFADDKLEKAIKKIQSKLQKDLRILQWFAQEDGALKNTLYNEICQNESSQQLIIQLLELQLRTLVTKQVYIDIKKNKKTHSMSTYQPLVPPPSLLDNSGNLNLPIKNEHWSSSFAANQVMVLTETILSLDPNYSLTTCFGSNQHESADEYHHRMTSVLYGAHNESHWHYLIHKYHYKISHKSTTQPLAEKAAWAFGATYVLYIYSFCLFFGGIGLASASLDVFDVKLSYTSNIFIGSFFALGAVLGGWFLNKPTTMKMVKKYFKNRREKSNKAQLAFEKLQRIQSKPENTTFKDRLKLLPHPIIKVTLATLTSIAFAGMNVISGMAAAKLISNPSSIQDIGALFRSVLDVKQQPKFVIVNGVASAMVAFANQLPFMIHFSSSTDPLKAGEKAKKLSPGLAWAFMANLMSTFAVSTNYFATSSWYVLFDSIGLGKTFTSSFGVISMSSMTFVCWFVFSDHVPVETINSLLKKNPRSPERSQRLQRHDPAVNGSSKTAVQETARFEKNTPNQAYKCLKP